MDANRFDAITRVVGSSPDRRGLLKTAAGGALGLVGLSALAEGALAKCKNDNDCKNGDVCDHNKCVECAKNKDCKNGKRCANNKCVECKKNSDCKNNQTCNNNNKCVNK
jgi:Cys-rich repeat protein